MSKYQRNKFTKFKPDSFPGCYTAIPDVLEISKSDRTVLFVIKYQYEQKKKTVHILLFNESFEGTSIDKNECFVHFLSLCGPSFRMYE